MYKKINKILLLGTSQLRDYFDKIDNVLPFTHFEVVDKIRWPIEELK